MSVPAEILLDLLTGGALVGLFIWGFRLLKSDSNKEEK